MILHRLIKTDFNQNNNKFWNVDWDENSGLAQVHWGRVGTEGQRKDFNWSRYDLERKLEEKRGKGYAELQLHKPTVVTSTGVSKEHPKVEEVSSIIFRAAGESISKFLVGSVDALSKDQLDQARALLPRIETLKALPQHRQPGSREYIELLDVIQSYFNRIPTVMPRRIDDKYGDIIAPFNPADQEDRLNQLEAALASHQVMATGNTSQYAALGAELKWLDPKNPAHAVFVNAFARKNMRIKEVFLVKSPVNIATWEAETLGKHIVASLDPAVNAKELRGITPVFHGTKNPYVRHILRSGIRIPSTSQVVNGSRFGRGAYFADDPYRSANYTQAGHGEPRMMFISDVAVGTWKELDGDDQRLTQAPAGYHSVRGVKSWSGMDEWIIYRAGQHRLMAFVTF